MSTLVLMPVGLGVCAMRKWFYAIIYFVGGILNNTVAIFFPSAVAMEFCY